MKDGALRVPRARLFLPGLTLPSVGLPKTWGPFEETLSPGREPQSRVKTDPASAQPCSCTPSPYSTAPYALCPALTQAAGAEAVVRARLRFALVTVQDLLHKLLHREARAAAAIRAGPLDAVDWGRGRRWVRGCGLWGGGQSGGPRTKGDRGGRQASGGELNQAPEKGRMRDHTVSFKAHGSHTPAWEDTRVHLS